MRASLVAGMVLIVLGAVVFAYGGFRHKSAEGDRHRSDRGDCEEAAARLSPTDPRRSCGLGGIVLIVADSRRRR